MSSVSDYVDFEQLPKWLKRPIGKSSELSRVQRVIKARQIHTICEEGRCPNRAECYSQGVATFLLLGSVCTRSCAFCQVSKGVSPLPLDPDEPQKVASAVEVLGLRYVVLTSVARDDLPDGGALRYVEVIEAIRSLKRDTLFEVLTPDFCSGNNCTAQAERVAVVVGAGLACYNHNIETVRRLQGPVRRGADYERSLAVLSLVKSFAPSLATKSGLMLGHGETVAEIRETLADLRSVGCDRVTLGQYMRPTLAHLPVKKYWSPEEFEELGEMARSLGFSAVSCGPLVRSSYHASEGLLSLSDDDFCPVS